MTQHDELNDCTICGAGKYSENIAQTSDCPAGTVGVNNNNVVGDHDEKADCTTCSSGKYQDGTGETSCEDCPVGRYRTADATNDNKNWDGTANGNNNGMNALADCTICGAGKYSENTAQTSDTCHDCPAGTVGVNNNNVVGDHDEKADCTTCSSGKYQDGTGETSCEDCPVGRYRTADATNDNKDWDGTANGNNDGMNALADCTICGAGKYSENIAQTSDTCSDCPVGRFGVNTNTDVTEHDQLSDCTICGAGKYSEAVAQTSDTCNNCPAGTVGVNNNNVVGDHDEKGDCTTCSSGKYQDGTGETSCEDCPVGRYRTADATNDNKNWDGTANGNNNGMNALADCTICGAGKYSENTAQTSDTCNNCPAGTVGVNNNNVVGDHDEKGDCTTCSSGKYQDGTGETSCEDCPVGRYRTADATNDNKNWDGTANGNNDGMNALADCTICGAGKYSENTAQTSDTCNNCPAGTVGVIIIML